MKKTETHETLTPKLTIKWRGHPTERRAEGKAAGLTYPVSVCHLVHCGSYGAFGIYYGGTLVEKVMSPQETDENGAPKFYGGGTTGQRRRPSYDTEQGYKLAKKRAQELAIDFFRQDEAATARVRDRQLAEKAERDAREKAAEERAADTAEALKLANILEEAAQHPGEWKDEPVLKLAALVKKLLG